MTPERPWARLVDYGVIFSSIYPIALYKIVNGTFKLGDVDIVIPSMLMRMETVYVEWIIFAGFLAAWIYKTTLEHRDGTLNVPKTSLIAVTIFFAFIVPGTAGDSRLELAFQSMNAWHSFQYLGLVWLINTMRTRARSAPKQVRGASLRFQRGEMVLRLELRRHAAALGVRPSRRVVGSAFGLQESQYYYMLTLSPLLIHYYFDTFVFLTSVADLVPLPSSSPTAPSPELV